MSIVGIDISEKHVRAAVHLKTDIRIITLRYKDGLNFNNIVELAKRLSDLQRTVKKTTQFTIKEAIVSTPAYLTIKDHAALKKCGALLGIYILRIIPNITTTAFYSAYKDLEDEKAILCYRFSQIPPA